jgi:chitin synthase
LKPGGKVDVNIPQDDGDLNAQYEAELAKFATKAPKEVQNISEEERQADYYKGFRSAVVLAWVFCNFALGAVVLSAAGLETFDNASTTSSTNQDATQTERSLIYMEVVLWSVAGLSMFKFLGAMWFLVVRMVSHYLLLSRLLYWVPLLIRYSSAAFDFRHFLKYDDCASFSLASILSFTIYSPTLS